MRYLIRISSFLFFYFSSFLWGINIEFTNLEEHRIPTETASSHICYYKLNANTHVQRFSKQSHSKLLFFNYQKYFLENSYYANGEFVTKGTSLFYKKAYIFSGKVYLFDVHGMINSKKVKAKKVIFDGYKYYQLSECEVKTTSMIYRREAYTLKEE